MADSDSLGDLYVNITGDFSDLDDSIAQATSVAQTGADQIASAFDQSDVGEEITLSLQGIGQAAQTASSQVDLFSTQVEQGGEQMDLFAGSAASVTDAVTTAQSAASGLSTSLSDVADGSSDASAGLEQVSSGATDAAESTAHAGEGASETEQLFSELGKTLLELTGIQLTAEGFKELAEATVEAFSTIQNASVALTAMSGSAAAAHEQIEGLESLANQDSLAFPSLLTGAQRMTAFGMSSEEVTQSLSLAADAAAATGNSFDQVNNSLARIVESGTAGARQLVQLGVTQQQLASIMGVTTTQVTADFKALDPTDRLAIISQALQKFSGDAQLMANTVTGATNQLANAWEHTASTVGASVGAIVGGLEAATAYVVSGFGVMWSETITKIQSGWMDLVTYLETGSTKGFAALQADAEEVKNGVDVIVAAFNQGKPAADQFFSSMAGSLAKLQENSGALETLSVDLDTAAKLYQSGKISLDEYNTTVTEYGAALDKASTNGENFADSLLGVATAQDKANNLLGESLQTLQQVTPGTAGYARAIQDVAAAWNAANPGGVQFANTLMGIQQEVSQQTATYRSLASTFAQVAAGFSAGTVSAALFLDTAAKLATAAKATGQAFASAAAEQTKVTQASAQNAAEYKALQGALAGLEAQDTQNAQTTGEIVATYATLQALAEKLGTTFYDQTAATLSLTSASLKQQDALADVSQTYVALASSGQKSALITQDLDTAFKTISTDAAAVGLNVTKVGTGLQFTADAANAANPQVKALATQFTTLYTSGVQFVTVNGQMVPLLADLATASMNAAIQAGTLGDSAIPSVTVSAKDAGAAIVTAGTSVENLGAAIDVTNIKVTAFRGEMSQMVGTLSPVQTALNNLANLFPQVTSDVEKLTVSATNQVSGAEAMVQAWVSLNSTQQTTVQGQLAVQNAFNNSRSALAALGIQLTATGAAYGGTSQAVQDLVTQLNQQITAMNQTQAAAYNTANAIAAVGSAATSAAQAVDALDQAEAQDNADFTNEGNEMNFGGSGGFSASGTSTLGMYAAAGASGSVLDNLAASLGLVKTGEKQYETIDQWNASVEQTAKQFNLTTETLASGQEVLTGYTAATTTATNTTTASAAATSAATTATTAAATASSSLADTMEVTGSSVDSAAQQIANQLLNGATSISYSSDTVNTANQLSAQVQEDLATAGSTLGQSLSNSATASGDATEATGTFTLAQTAAATATTTATTAVSALTTAAGVASTALQQIASASSTADIYGAQGLPEPSVGATEPTTALPTGYSWEQTSLNGQLGWAPQWTGGTASSGIVSTQQFGDGTGSPYGLSTDIGSELATPAYSGQAYGGIVVASQAEQALQDIGSAEPYSSTNGAAPQLNITVQAGVVAGQNGMQQLAQMVQQTVITQLRQAGLKI